MTTTYTSDAFGNLFLITLVFMLVLKSHTLRVKLSNVN